MERPQPSGEDLGLCQKLQVSMEVQLAILKSLFERVDELAAKEFTSTCLAGNSCRGSESNRCDQARGRRPALHNAHAGER
jgi:hypothetical protein